MKSTFIYRVFLKLTVILFLGMGFLQLHAQTYNNEWIDYSKTYYKFKVGKTGLYRISAATLQTAGLDQVPSGQFQLWRNGKQVPVYISTTSDSALGGNNYIEFWGERNDGKPDKALYKNQNNQLSDYYSLETDSAAFFLTVNENTASNLRLKNADNTVPDGATPEPYFMYTWGTYPKNQINPGRASYYGGLYVYSSSYDVGEGWTSGNTASGGNGYAVTASSLYPYEGGPDATVSAAVVGASVLGTKRTISLLANSQTVASQDVNMFATTTLSATIPNASLPSSIPFSVTAVTDPANSSDRFVVSYITLSYPRLFNFGNANTFTFGLPAKATGSYLQITNFATGNIAPILYDLTNGQRYVCAQVSGTLRFYLPASQVDRNLVLVGQQTAVINPVAMLTPRTFVDYKSTAQGNYLIITGSVLRSGDGDAVDQYRQYRSSTEGGGYHAQIYDVSQLEDQFAFGIRNHPSSIKNFLKYARNTFSEKPQFAFLIGRGVTYNLFNSKQADVNANRMNIVPTFGYPASDVLLASDNLDPVSATAIGRISAVTQDEVAAYLSKIKEYEQAQKDQTQTISGKAWMKNVVDIAGGNNESESNTFISYLKTYENILTDTLMGATVYNFNKNTNATGAAISDQLLRQLFLDGFSMLNYWGHSSSTTLDYNLDEPTNYQNQGKYPVIYVNGCDVAGFYDYTTSRLNNPNTIPESYIFAANSGSIAFIAQSYLGVTNFLQSYSLPFYTSLGQANYGKPITASIQVAQKASTVNASGFPYDSYGNIDTLTAYATAEENTFLGDPAIKLNSFEKPDFAIEDAQVYVSPSYISVADNKFHVKAYMYNLGKATGDSLLVQVKRQYPNGSTVSVFNKNIPSVKYKDSIEFDIPVIGTQDKGSNNLLFSLDPENKYDELTKVNNTLTKNVFIYENGLTPIYPYEYSIVNKQNIKLIASTANPIAATANYAMEIDTTALFNSPLKVHKTISSFGGTLEFDPGLSFTDSVVYYWRVAAVPASGDDYHWNSSSFLYLAKAASGGYNQSHLYQHLASDMDRITLDSTTRQWKFGNLDALLEVRHGIVSTSSTQQADFYVKINAYATSVYWCTQQYAIVFNVFDGKTLQPYFNSANPSLEANTAVTDFYPGSTPVNCRTLDNVTWTNFEFDIRTLAGRNAARDFMSWIPNDALVVTRLFWFPSSGSFPLAADWQKDQDANGAGNTLYDKLKAQGFSTLDNFTQPQVWAFVYRNNNNAFKPFSYFSQGLYDQLRFTTNIYSSDTLGYITSPKFGPAKLWKTVLWNGNSIDSSSTDNASIDVIGVTSSGNTQLLNTLQMNEKSLDISSISATEYPYLQLRMRNADSINYTPYQLKYWRILYDPVPEGALAANIYYKAGKDSLDVGQPNILGIAFKNISDTRFADSIKVNYTLYDKSNQGHLFSLPKLKPLEPGDTAQINISMPTGLSTQGFNMDNFTGLNNQYLDVNPDNDQPEQTHINNFLYKNLYISTGNTNTSMDVTFDGIHILNNDIVAAKPQVAIKIQGESKYRLLNDTSIAIVQLRYPDGTLKRFGYGNDTLRFTPAKDSTDNVALVDFAPYLTQDGTYQLLITSKTSDETATASQYSVSFQVYNKPMISDMFNYPNPFTTSTAFVFTITGSQVPQNIRIEILTITGKIVKEITKAELGDLHVGRNITEYKWDGTDQYGNKLANGVYIYRVITNQDGKKLDRFEIKDTNGNSINTGRYFNKGYGKMYLMR